MVERSESENVPLPRRHKTETNPHGSEASTDPQSPLSADSHDERQPLLLLTVRVIYFEMYFIAFLLGVIPTRLLSFLGATSGFGTDAGRYSLQYTALFSLGIALVLSAVAQCDSKVQRKVLQYLQTMFWIFVYIGSKATPFFAPWASNLIVGSAAFQGVLLAVILYGCHTNAAKRDL